MQSQSTITLRLQGDTWLADVTGPLGEDYQRLFGTRLIPTAYLAGTPAALVLREIQQLNPDTIVGLA